ncbi:MAG: hypothetical protein EOO92_26930 [Pedobacter sp.]|nr:MAG: hypothetical protein EOO92_26930 [Pedobacter sp.]
MKKILQSLLFVISFTLLTSIKSQASHLNTNTLKGPAGPTIKRLQPEHSGTNTLTYSVVLDEAVTGLNTTNFSLSATGIPNASIIALSGSGSNYVVTVATGTGNGSITLRLINTSGITQPHQINTPVIGETYLITKNFVNPVLRIQAENPFYNGNSSMIDAVEVINADDNTIVNDALINASFENYDGKPTPFRYNPTGANWTFNVKKLDRSDNV